MIKNPLVEWAKLGTRTPVYDVAKKMLGWITGEPPEEFAWNEVEYNRDVMINHVKALAERLMTAPNCTPTDICSELIDPQWVDPAETPNILDMGEDVRGACMGWDFSADAFRLLVLTSGSEIYPVTGCSEYGSNPAKGSAIALAFPATPDEIYALCSDAGYIYVVWGVTGGNFKVSKFAANVLAEVWTADTGIAITYSSTSEDVRIIVSSSDTVTALLPDVAFGMTYRQVGVFNKATGAGSYGTGSYVDGYGDSFDRRNAKIVSDGTHVFWIQYQAGAGDREYFLMSASLADPTTSDYTSTLIGTVSDSVPWSRPKGLIRKGSDIFIGRATGYVQFFSTVDEEMKSLYSMTLKQGPLYEGEQGVPFGYDGMNLWGTLLVTDAGHAGRLTEIAFKLPAGTPTSQEADTGYDGITPASVAITAVVAAETDYTPGDFLFDHYDMWLVKRTGKIYRITNPGARQ